MENNTHIPEDRIMTLHDTLADAVIKFFKAEGLPEDAWAVHFSFDDLRSSVLSGKWVPYSDSSLEVVNTKNETLIFDA